MFIGIQINGEREHMALMAETREEIQMAAGLRIDRIDEVEWAATWDGVIYTDRAKYQEAKQAAMREVRDTYLQSYVDPVVSNPLRWGDLSDDVKAKYENYRRYLLDYTKPDGWWETAPMTLDEWKKEGENAVQEKEIS